MSESTGALGMHEPSEGTVGGRMRAERERQGISLAEMARRMQMAEQEYTELEEGRTEVEVWAPLLGHFAMVTSRPTSRFMAASGRWEDAVPGKVGPRLREIREELRIPMERMVDSLPISVAEYAQIEQGVTGMEVWPPKLLKFANLTGIPIYNFIIDLPLQELPLKPVP
eukprot:RCo054192